MVTGRGSGRATTDRRVQIRGDRILPVGYGATQSGVDEHSSRGRSDRKIRAFDVSGPLAIQTILFSGGALRATKETIMASTPPGDPVGVPIDDPVPTPVDPPVPSPTDPPVPGDVPPQPSQPGPDTI